MTHGFAHEYRLLTIGIPNGENPQGPPPQRQRMIALKPENVVDVLFGNRLRQLLDERNISQAHFADRIGVSRSRMNNYVAQRSEPDYATLIRIANTLDTSIDFLLGKSEHQGLPQTACLSGFPDFIPSRGAGGEPPDPSCWIPLYGSQYEAP